MKRIHLIIVSALAGLGLASCVSILDQEPLDSFTDEAVWSDLSLSEAYLNKVYNTVRGQLSTNTLWDNFSEEIYHKHGYGTNNTTHCLMSPDAAYICYYEDNYNLWGNYYSYINTINNFLVKIDEVPGDETERNWQKGQALFLRGWYYSLLYTLYGRVVLVDTPYALDSQFTARRAEMDDVADFICKDLDAAAAILPTVYPDPSDLGRATKGAALALKSRVLLLKASPLFGTPSKEKWQAASDAAKAVMDLNVYHLELIAPEGTLMTSPEDRDQYIEKYAALFYNASSPESIWMKVYNTNYSDAWSDTNSTPMGQCHRAPCGPGNGFEGWGTFDPTQNLVNKIQNYDGTPQKPYSDNTKNPWENLELRYWANIIGDGALWGYGDDKRQVETYIAGEESVTPGLDSSQGEYWWNASNTGYAVRKSYSPDFDYYGTTQWDAPWMFIRLAEIYLNYAECQYQLGNNSEALKYVNIIRHRALLPDATGDVWEAIEYEREVEMMFEGTRWTDMRRWKRMDEEYADPVIGCEVKKFADGHKEYNLNVFIDQREWKGDKYYWVPLSRSEYNKSPEYLDMQPYE